MLCPRCNKNVATLRVTEVTEFLGHGDPENQVEEHPLCEVCAQQLGLPSACPPGPAQMAQPQIWKLLQLAQKGLGKGAVFQGKLTVSARPSPSCASCGMTLEELRRQGRVGCEECYPTFGVYLDESLERLHGSTQHVGRLPGIPESELERRHVVEGLKGELEVAVREEDYERAASLRDEIQSLDVDPGGSLA